MRVKGQTLQQIADWLNTRGYITRRDKRWSPTQVARVLSAVGRQRIIIGRIAEYRSTHNSDLRLTLATHGNGEKTQKRLAKLLQHFRPCNF